MKARHTILYTYTALHRSDACLDNKTIEHGLRNVGQLYDLERDPGEKQNLAEKLPAQAERMQHTLDAVVAGQKLQ
jgi:hypothetical protein